MAASDDPAARLADLLTKANLQYSLKNYTAAADVYSEAAEAQSALRGEMAPENADLLYLYGRCLYKVAIAKSDVLGGRVAGEEKKKKTKKAKGGKAKEEVKEEPAAGEGDEKKPEGGDEKAAAQQQQQQPSVESKPYFQIIGDENWDTESESDSDAEDQEDAEDDDDDDDDDLATAYEILDLARVLLTKQLEDHRAASTTSKGKAKAKANAAPTDTTERKLLERLADTHDLQAEIGLENERFHDAVADFRAALALKQDLFPHESALVAEAHFKLSLALEFASMTRVREAQARAEAGEKVDPGDATVDDALRAEAVTHMESAIGSCRARIAGEEAVLPSLEGDKARQDATRQIADVKDMVEDMEARLADLRAPAVTTGNPADPAAPNPLLSGLLADVLGSAGAAPEERAAQAQKIQAASDISGLVKRRKPAAGAAGGEKKKKEDVKSEEAKGKKRSADEMAVEEGGEAEGKRIKSEGEGAEEK